MLNKNKAYIFIIFLLLMISCSQQSPSLVDTSKQNEQIKFISGVNYKYWDDIDTIRGKFLLTRKFYSNGKYELYRYDRSLAYKKMRSFPDDTSTWKISNDSLFFPLGACKLLKLTNDTLIFHFTEYHSYEDKKITIVQYKKILAKSPRQLDD